MPRLAGSMALLSGLDRPVAEPVGVIMAISTHPPKDVEEDEERQFGKTNFESCYCCLILPLTLYRLQIDIAVWCSLDRKLAQPLRKDFWEFFIKLNIHLPMSQQQYSYSFPKRNDCIHPKRFLQNDYSSVIHTRQKLETNQMSIDRGTDKFLYSADYYSAIQMTK